MYKTVKTQTNLPVKICHLKVYDCCLMVLPIAVREFNWTASKESKDR